MNKKFLLFGLLLLVISAMVNLLDIKEAKAVSVMDASVSVTANDPNYDINNHQTIGQIFTASHNKIDEVKLFMSGNGQWMNNFVIAIIHYTGERIFVDSAEGTISPNASWVGFSFANATVIPGDQYAIIVPPGIQSPLWYYKLNSAYAEGEAIVDTNYRANDDFGFIIYASEADPAPKPADNPSGDNQANPATNSGSSDSVSNQSGNIAAKSVAALEQLNSSVEAKTKGENTASTNKENSGNWLRKISSSNLFWPISIPVFTILTVLLIWFIIIRTKVYRNPRRD